MNNLKFAHMEASSLSGITATTVIGTCWPKTWKSGEYLKFQTPGSDDPPLEPIPPKKPKPKKPKPKKPK